MTRSLRQSMAWIHGWLGLLAGWILFAMFLTGTASYFRPEITRWMQPELSSRIVAPADAAAAAVAHLQRVGGDDIQWFIDLPDDRTRITRVFEQFRPGPGTAPPRNPELVLDAATGAPVAARDTRGGEQFYRFHFQLQLPYPWGRWLAGLAAMFMLGAIVSGVITHKRIFVDFFTLRWNKGQRSWLDAHNVSAVLALPYHAMITYTGLMTLVAMYMPWPVAANYAKPLDFGRDAYGFVADADASGVRAPLYPVGTLVRDAERRLGLPAGRVVVRNPGDRAATVAVYSRGGTALNARGASVTYAGATGVPIAISGGGGSGVGTAGVMLGLHVAQFAGPALRWALFLLGATGAAMVGTGLLLWTAARRRPGRPGFAGLKLVERLNIGVVAGLPIGMASYLLANRLIPADLAGRADLEVSTMFWAWGIVAVAQLVRPAHRAWPELFALGALAFAAIPLVDMVITDRGLPASLIAGDWLFVGFDTAMIALAALLALASWRAGRPREAKVRRTRRALAHV